MTMFRDSFWVSETNLINFLCIVFFSDFIVVVFVLFTTYNSKHLARLEQEPTNLTTDGD